MSLPFDPATVDPEDFGEQQATLEMDHEEAIQYVRAVCEEAGFGFPAEFSPSKMLNEKVDADREPYYVLGACNPKMADRALDATGGKIGALFPCNMVIWQAEPGVQRVYHVSIMKIARLLGMSTDDEELDDIIDETGKMVETVFEQLENKPA
ncbi:uncharacterized protein (DUF302 family) [Halohasta litchfieldiae]|jgi:uncharacterized protein (DUF302 family)|uniref:Uncharacterized conserved protein, DUF302 family n=1 Tax=Halohasta litchfieldiae TaxID=1073996 RepID=A0A1H6UU09_9EURY|nr:DUF302 domain-containing protein [Halohasta litchfieldiae]ATW88408.1 uncharacterized protein (DUF302 family) [Halohasta litchfieldiae]SEI95166.1 Uncharacterized conserved protein, DUF302 family [Halohasta litchfieldiae]